MRLINRFSRVMLVAALLLTSFITSSSVANAASVYDDVFEQAPSLIADNALCETTRDFSLDWFSVATDVETEVIYPDDTYAATQRAALLDSIQNGGHHFVYEHPTDAGYIVVFSYDSNAKLEFFWDGWNPHYRIVSTNGTSNVGALHVTTQAIRYGSSACGDWGLQSYIWPSSVFNASYNIPLGHSIFINSFPTAYPEGYEGVYIQSEYTPPAPVLYYGTADCGGTHVQSVLIHQDGNTGAASWDYQPSTQHRADWEYPLTSSPYSISVGCGVSPSVWTLITSPGVDDTPYINNDWICTNYCVQ